MTRFLVGFAAGALVFALIQYVFAPMPTLENSTTRIDPQRQVSSDRESDTVQGNRQSAQDTETAGADNRQFSGRIEAPASSADTDESIERESERSEEARSGPENPIELPDTHAGFVDKSTPSLPDEHARVEEEDVDSSWAEYVEAQIYSFITSHQSGEQIRIVSLVCRTTRCEIAGSVFGEQGGDIWSTVLGDMRRQPWFSSNFADSMFGSGSAYPGEFRFIAILARVGTEIGPPVPQ